MRIPLYLGTCVLMISWILFWAIASISNKESAYIGKRGLWNMLFFSFTIAIVFCENLTTVDYFWPIYLMIPCSPHLLINYTFFGAFIVIYFYRGTSLLTEKKLQQIQNVNAQQMDKFFSSLSFMERSLINAKKLGRLLRDSDMDYRQVIEDYMVLKTSHKPSRVLKKTLLFMLCGFVIGSIVLVLNPEKLTEAYCAPVHYIPVYATMLLCIFSGMYTWYLLGKQSDPYFLKYEFVVQFGVVTPLFYTAGFVLLGIANDNWSIFIVAIILNGHLFSIVIPNILAFRQRYQELNDDRSILSRSSSIKDNMKQMAIERYCVELVLFREDYEDMQYLKTNEEQVKKGDEIYNKFLRPNAPYEVNISHISRKKATTAFTSKDYQIYEKIDKEVKRLLYDNLGFD